MDGLEWKPYEQLDDLGWNFPIIFGFFHPCHCRKNPAQGLVRKDQILFLGFIQVCAIPSGKLT